MIAPLKFIIVICSLLGAGLYSCTQKAKIKGVTKNTERPTDRNDGHWQYLSVDPNKKETFGVNENIKITTPQGIANKPFRIGNSGQLGNNSQNIAYNPVQVETLTSGIKVITAGERHACAINNDDDLWCWGLNSSGQLGNDNSAFASQSLIPIKVNGF